MKEEWEEPLRFFILYYARSRQHPSGAAERPSGVARASPGVTEQLNGRVFTFCNLCEFNEIIIDLILLKLL